MSLDPTPVSDRARRETRFWSDVAPSYDSWIEAAFEDQYITFKDHMAQAVGPEDRVLEVGSGTGNISLHIAPHVGSVVGVDISPEMVKVAREKASGRGFGNVEFQVGDGYDLPFEDGSFDKVVCVNVLQTMKAPKRAIREGLRVLREGGEMISVTYAYGDSSVWETVKLARWVVKYGKPAYWSNLKAVDLARLFAEEGFDIVEDVVVWRSPRVVLLRARRPVIG